MIQELEQVGRGVFGAFFQATPYKVFLSHSSGNDGLARAIRAAGQKVGVSVYLFQEDQQPGILISEKIQREIDGCDAFLVLLTEEAALSSWVHQEIGYARGREKPVIPVMAGKPPSGRLGLLDGLEYVPLDEQRIQEFLADLTHLLHAKRVEKARGRMNRAFAAVLLGLGFWVGSKLSPDSDEESEEPDGP